MRNCYALFFRLRQEYDIISNREVNTGNRHVRSSRETCTQISASASRWIRYPMIYTTRACNTAVYPISSRPRGIKNPTAIEKYIALAHASRAILTIHTWMGEISADARAAAFNIRVTSRWYTYYNCEFTVTRIYKLTVMLAHSLEYFDILFPSYTRIRI